MLDVFCRGCVQDAVSSLDYAFFIIYGSVGFHLTHLYFGHGYDIAIYHLIMIQPKYEPLPVGSHFAAVVCLRGLRHYNLSIC